MLSSQNSHTREHFFRFEWIRMENTFSSNKFLFCSDLCIIWKLKFCITQSEQTELTKINILAYHMGFVKNWTRFHFCFWFSQKLKCQKQHNRIRKNTSVLYWLFVCVCARTPVYKCLAFHFFYRVHVRFAFLQSIKWKCGG